MTMDRDEQEIKRAFQSLKTPEYDIASAVLQEKNSRCEIVPLRKIAVMAVSLLVVVSLLSVVAIANFGQGKWAEPGSSLLPMAGNDMAEQSKAESSEASSLLLAEDTSAAEDNWWNEDWDNEEELSIMMQKCDPEGIAIVCNKNTGFCPVSTSETTQDIETEEEFKNYLENFAVPVKTLGIPEEYHFSMGMAGYPVTMEDVAGAPDQTEESENFIGFFFQKPMKRMRQALWLSGEFQSEETGDFLEISFFLEEAIPVEIESDKERYGFDCAQVDSEYMGNQCVQSYGQFYQSISPVITEHAEYFGDSTYQKEYGRDFGKLAGKDQYVTRKVYPYLSISISSGQLPEDQIIAIAQSIQQSLQ